MRRADRLFGIIQVLRRTTGPVTGDALAAALETSRRTVYRDIATLIGQRVPIRGEAGVGYVLEKGYDLPPLMLTSDEVEAVTLGAQWVVTHADAGLARAGLAVLAKLAAVVPEELQLLFDDPALGTPAPRRRQHDVGIDIGRLREWSRRGRKVRIACRDERGAYSERTVWPFMVGYVGATRALMAWCEKRVGFRSFLTERIASADFLEERYADRPAVLRRRWLAAQAVDDERDRPEPR